jgi:hypothetical protein
MTPKQHTDPGCETLVVAVASAGAHRLGKLTRPLVESAVMAALERGNAGRYDLLTLAPNAESADPAQADLIAEHIRSAVERHHVRKVVVALPEASDVLAKRLSAAVADPKVDFRPIDLRRFGPHDLPLSEHVAVACMDWRMHGASGGLLATLAREYGDAPYALFTMAGGAKWAAEPESPRGAFLIEALARAVKSSTPLAQIHLFAHLDCGGYGGNEAFPDTEHQLIRLTGDMRAALSNVSEAARKVRWGVKVTAGIIELHDCRVSMIRRVQ